MKSFAWSAAMMMVGGCLLASGQSACSSDDTSGGSSGSTSGSSSGSASGGSSGDASVGEASSGGSSEASTSEASTEGGGDAGTCSLEVPDGADACTMCLIQSCCTSYAACQNEPMDDAGSTDCVAIDSCFNDCTTPPADSGVEAGSATDCITQCEMGHTAAGTADFTALITCAMGSCSTQCQ